MTNGRTALFNQIADEHCSEDKLIYAISHLGADLETPDFWLNIANNESYSIFHRRHCIFQLFYRHVTPNMNLNQMSQILKRSRWLALEQISVVEDLGGHIPVEMTFDNTVLALNILPDPKSNLENWFVYVSITEQISAKDFYRQVIEGLIKPIMDKAIIQEIGFSPPVINSFRTS